MDKQNPKTGPKGELFFPPPPLNPTDAGLIVPLSQVIRDGGHDWNGIKVTVKQKH
jgi:hypothetical protein